jgi:DNA polymerase-3 subunit epsilon
VTGHTWEMLKDEPKFIEIVDQFLDFVQDSPLVAHNAGFDMGFINMELERCGKPPIDPNRALSTPPRWRARSSRRAGQPRRLVQTL